MKILAINGSPKGKQSCTHRMLDPFLAGMRDVGAETEIVNLSEFKIHHCTGCYACWYKTPGKCIIKDDMAEILEKLIKADIIVYGTPLYVYSMTGLMKNFLDRCLPLALPWMNENKTVPDVTGLSSRYSGSYKTFLVSPCGLPELKHFEHLVNTFKYMTKMAGGEYLGEILRPMGPLLQNEALQKQLASYFELLRIAGQQLIQNGKIDAETMRKLREDILPGGAKAYREMTNQRFKEMLGKV